MTNHVLFAAIILWAIFGLLLTIGGKWLVRSRNRPQPQKASKLQVLPVPILIIGIVGMLFYLVAAILSYEFRDKIGAPHMSSMFLLFSIFSSFLIAGYYLDRSEIVDGGLYYRRILGRSSTLRWCEVTSLKYSQSCKWFRIQTTNGSVVRISTMMTGLPEFARMALEHIPENSIDLHVQVILKETASGNPPSIFG